MWHVTAFKGAAWFFNFYDSDGSAVRRPGIPYMIGSYPKWWSINNARCLFNVRPTLPISPRRLHPHSKLPHARERSVCRAQEIVGVCRASGIFTSARRSRGTRRRALTCVCRATQPPHVAARPTPRGRRTPSAPCTSMATGAMTCGRFRSRDTRCATAVLGSRTPSDPSPQIKMPLQCAAPRPH